MAITLTENGVVSSSFEFKTASDTLTVFDVGTSPGIPAESKSDSDTVYLGSGTTPTRSESLTLTDSGRVDASTASTLVRDTATLSDTGSVVETPVSGIPKLDSDSITASETNNSITTSSDGVELNLADTGAVAVAQTKPETVTLGESTVLSIGPNQNPTSPDSVGLTEQAAVTALLASLDGFTVSDPAGTVSEGGQFFIDTSDSLGIVETVPSTLALASVADAFSLFEGSPSWSAGVNASETVVMAEQPVAGTAVMAGVDTLLLSDSGSRSDFLGRAVGSVTIQSRLQSDAEIVARLLGDVTFD